MFAGGFVRFSMFRLALFCLCCLTVAAAFAQVPAAGGKPPLPPDAWRRTIGNSNGNEKASNIITDLSGNGLFEYSDTDYCHIAKISPANNIIFDVKTVGNVFIAKGMCVSPLVSGKQYAWGTGLVNSSSGQKQAYYVCYDLTSPSVAVVQGTYASTNGDLNVIGQHADALGNLMLAMNDVDSLGHHFLRMVTIDRLNNVTNDQTNTALEPQSAYWNSATNSWIAAGYNPPTTSTSARWGSYDPTDGSEKFSAHALGYVLGTHVVTYRYVVNPLPGGDI